MKNKEMWEFIFLKTAAKSHIMLHKNRLVALSQQILLSTSLLAIGLRLTVPSHEKSTTCAPITAPCPSRRSTPSTMAARAASKPSANFRDLPPQPAVFAPLHSHPRQKFGSCPVKTRDLALHPFTAL